MTLANTFHQAQQLFEAGKLQESEKLCRAIINQDHNFSPAYFQLAVIASAVQNYPIALEMMSKALLIHPTSCEYHRAYGEINRRAGHIDTAIQHATKAIQCNANDADSWYNLGVAYAQAEQHEEAINAYQHTLKIQPQYGVAYNNLGTSFEKLERLQEAMEAYKKAIHINPKHTEAQNNLGAIHITLGNIEQAKIHFEQALAASPHFFDAHYNLSSLKTYQEKDPDIQMLTDFKERAKQLPLNERTRYYFTLGKAMEDIGNYEEAIQAFHEGNHLVRESITFDISTIETGVDQLIAHFDTSMFDTGKDQLPTTTPIFIVGMPRSGSTLIEQILSSHSDIFGAGELKDFTEATLATAPDLTEFNYYKWLSHASTAQKQQLQNNYIERLKKHNAQASFITDKMPGNFFFIGLIASVLPHAKIIHTIRNPMDTCLSNYSKLFKNTLPFTYNLEELGRYYVAYERLMKFWNSIIPKDRILNVVYENVVENVETQAKNIIEFLGLEWEPNCLEFYKNKRRVQTASMAQVRKPIYKKSLNKWQHYQSHLKELEAIISPRKQ